MNKVFSCLLLLLSLLYVSCGNRKALTGGKEDVEKPTIVSIIPEQFSDLTGKNIEITFSKPIDRSSVYSGDGGIYIYPLITNKKFRWKDNVLTIEIDETLQVNQNYHLTVSQQVKDMRRNNLDKDYHFTFHTGTLLYGNISGTITYELEEDQNSPITLNVFSADSLRVFQQEAKKNYYRIDYLSDNDYIVKAFIDKNQNKKYDFGREPYFESTFNPSKQRSLNLIMEYDDDTEPEIKSITVNHCELMTIQFNKHIKELTEPKILAKDSLATEVRIISYDIIGDRLEIVTTPLDSLNYHVVLSDVKDKKNNVAKELRREIKGKTDKDKTYPEIITTSPRNGAVINTLLPELDITFSKYMKKDFIKTELFDSISKKNIPIIVEQKTSRVISIKPLKPLEGRLSHQLIIYSDTSDIFGISLKENFELQFLPIKKE